MSVISVQVNQGPAQIPAGVVRKSTTVAVVDAAGAAQAFSLDGTESPVGLIPAVTVAAGDGTVTVSDIDANGAVIGAPIVVKYSTVPVVPVVQLASSGATVTVQTP
jgi:hypothetical protein